MAEKRIIVCDACGKQESRRYSVTRDGDTFLLDLCVDHAGPIEELLATGAKQRKRGPRKRTVKVDQVPKFSGA